MLPFGFKMHGQMYNKVWIGIIIIIIITIIIIIIKMGLGEI